MKYFWKYKTPEGFDDLVMCGDADALTGLWFAGSRDTARCAEAGGSTGEAWWLGAFLSKWTKERTFLYEELQTLTQWYLEHQMPTL